MAAGAGDGGDRLRLSRMECGGGQRERTTRVVDLDKRNGVWKPFRPLFGDDRRRARGDGLLGEMRSVGLRAGDRDIK